MNLKRAKKLRKVTGYHPSDERAYGYDFDKTTARPVQGYSLLMARILGQMIISRDQAAAIGVSVDDEHELYSIKKQRVFCIGNRGEYLTAKKQAKRGGSYAYA